MEGVLKNTKIFGLVGKGISYSFSKQYFTLKFKDLNLTNYKYQNFDIESIEEFRDVLKNQKGCLKGLNVTIPYKEVIFPFLDQVDVNAQQIGAVNTIQISEKGFLKGYNTDEYGFRKSLKPLLRSFDEKALVLGTGGASKAVLFALKKLGIKAKLVSRVKSELILSYKDITKDLLQEYTVIINCTPLGTFPDIGHCPDIPYQFVDKKHLLYDLVYNPSETLFLKKGREQGAITKNGLEMLELQAEKAWLVWNGDD